MEAHELSIIWIQESRARGRGELRCGSFFILHLYICEGCWCTEFWVHSSAFRTNTFTPHSHRATSYTLLNLTPRTGTPSSPFPESVFQRAEQLCEDQRPQQSGALTELPHFTDYEPNRLAEDRNYRHITGDGQFTENEDLRVRPFSFHQSIIASTYEPAESIATHPESDIDDEQLHAGFTTAPAGARIKCRTIAPNPGVLASSEPTPEKPLRRGGAQGLSGSSIPNWIPNRGVQVEPVLMILQSTYIRPGRRAACRDR